MENGLDGKILAEKFSALAVSTATTVQSHTVSDSNSNFNFSNDDSSVFQVIKAVEAAEATIKQQVEENNRLRIELHKTTQELEKYKLGKSIIQRSRSADEWNESDNPGSYGAHQLPIFISKDGEGVEDVGTNLPTFYNELKPRNDGAVSINDEILSESSKLNGTPIGVLPRADNAGFSQFSSPSTTSLSPSRHQTEGHDSRFNVPGCGLMPVGEVNNSNNIWKQDLIVKIQEHEEEIMQLRKHLVDFSVKEAQVLNEKYVLEKRIAYMRLAFDQQQQDLVDAASKALSYRQDIMEENIRLTYALQDAQQERSTFISYLLPLLAEYSLQPPVPDAQSIVSNVKVLFKHLQEKLLLTESKLKESQYQLTPWRSDLNQSNFSSQSPYRSIGAAITTSEKNGLELVPQPSYSNQKIPISSSDTQATLDWGLQSHHQIGSGGGGVGKNLEPADLRRYPPLESRNVPYDLAAMPIAQGTEHGMHYIDAASNKQVSFREPLSNSEIDYSDAEVGQNEKEPTANWSAGNSPFSTGLDDPSSSYSPYLPPVLEEPSSSFSEAADDDPLPAIEGLQISGEAFPGQKLEASGYSINGTTSCNFEWVRHLEDGSVKYIEGAKQPNYIVTADDVNTILAIEVQPLDNRKRKGEVVRVFANENKKITCDSSMHNYIQKTLISGLISFDVSLSTGYLNFWEPATLTIKREGYSVKCKRPDGVVVTEKFSSVTSVEIPPASPTEFSIISARSAEHLRTDNSSDDISCSRDTIVLTLRLFILKAGERRKGKKRSLFFNK